MQLIKSYFEDKLLLSHLIPSHHENAFKYLLNRDESSSERNITVNGIDDFNGSPHKNKKAFDVDMIYTTGTQNYDSTNWNKYISITTWKIYNHYGILLS